MAMASHVSAFAAKNELWLELLDQITEKNETIEITREQLMARSGKNAVETAKAFERLVRDGQLIRVGGIHVYRKTIQYIVNLIHEYFQSHDTLSVGELRDMLNTSRKTAVPLLEYLDTNKYTYRNGDLRSRGPNLKPI